MGKAIEIRVLGELEVLRDGHPLALPPSRKTRALLAYLLLTERSHLRQRLCDLFWEGPDDPRGALRWSLSRIRKLVDADGGRRLWADRERVVLDRGGIAVDLDAARDVASGNVEAVALEALRAAAGAFRGELLEGLELPDCYQYHGWCVAERERARQLRLSILATLLGRLDDHAERLAVAREWATVDSLTQDAHAAVIRELAALGRRREALAQYDMCRALVREAFGSEPSEALRKLKDEVASGAVPPTDVIRAPVAVPVSPSAKAPLIGRAREADIITRMVAAAREGASSPLLLVTGEPGIGKSRLLSELGDRLAKDGLALWGQAFEAEMMRPFGPWVEAFRPLASERVPAELRLDLAPLFPARHAPRRHDPDRNRLFGAVVQLLGHLSSSRPVALLLDDLQWFDSISLSLLHFVARSMDGCGRLVIACAVRPADLVDHPDARRLLRSLGREGLLRELRLAPLAPGETARLVDGMKVDADRVYRISEGNPFVALEVASALARGEESLPDSVEQVIADRLGQAGTEARAVLPWAAALGARFGADVLARATGHPGGVLADAMAELEERGILASTPTGDYGFVHDLLRRVAYRSISEPRRRMLHRQIALALADNTKPDSGWAADVVRHAELGGDHGMVARACVVAAEHNHRLFAIPEAMRLAGQGLGCVERLPEAERLEARMALLRVRVLAASSAGIAHAANIEDQVLQAIRAAGRDGHSSAAAAGHYLLSVIHEDRGDIDRARTDTLRAAAAGRGSDAATMARQLANTARCLLQLDMDHERARGLIEEASRLCERERIEEVELYWGLGLLAHRDGDHGTAVAQIDRALVLSRDTHDSWRECNCLAWLATVEYERGNWNEARRHCNDLKAVAGKMGEGAKGTHAEAVEALVNLAEGAPGSGKRLDAVLERLRAEDNKTLLAYALNQAARHYQTAGVAEYVRRFAKEALSAATAVGRQSEVMRAKETLAKLPTSR